MTFNLTQKPNLNNLLADQLTPLDHSWNIGSPSAGANSIQFPLHGKAGGGSPNDFLTTTPTDGYTC